MSNNILLTSSYADSSNNEISLDQLALNISTSLDDEKTSSTTCRKHYSDQNLLFPRPTQFFRQVSDPVSQADKDRVIDLEVGTVDNQNSQTNATFSRKRFVRAVNRMLSDLSGSNIGVVEHESIRFGEVVETFYCLVCMENCSVKESFSPGACVSKHRYCRACMSGYATSQLSDGQISVSCPGVSECHSALDDVEIKQLVTEELFEKYERLKLVKTDVNYRECPKCNAGTSDHNTSLPPAITCLECGYVYCFYHNNAHEGQSCEHYIRSMNRQMRRNIRASEGLVRKTTRLCPSCGVPIEKNGGCNHM
jgi:hypothetical protein